MRTIIHAPSSKIERRKITPTKEGSSAQISAASPLETTGGVLVQRQTFASVQDDDQFIRHNATARTRQLRRVVRYAFSLLHRDPTMRGTFVG